MKKNMKMERIDVAMFSETLADGTKKDKLYVELSPSSLQELIEEFDKVNPGDGSITDYPRYEVLRGIIADKLNLIPRDLLLLLIRDELKKLYDAHNELEDHFENHRHNIEKTYGEKPVW